MNGGKLQRPSLVGKATKQDFIVVLQVKVRPIFKEKTPGDLNNVPMYISCQIVPDRKMVLLRVSTVTVTGQVRRHVAA